MNIRTVRIALLASAALTGTVLTGCGTVGEVVEKAAKPPTPAESLLAAVPHDKTPIFRYAVKGTAMPQRGVLDIAGGIASVEYSEKIADAGGIRLTTKAVLTADRSWVKIAFTDVPDGVDLPKFPKKWMELDRTRLSPEIAEDVTYRGETDPGFVSTLVEASAGLAETSPGHFAGTTDLSRSMEAEIIDEKQLAALGDAAKSAPFEATVDDQGRLRTAAVTIRLKKTVTYRVTYDRYGEAAAPRIPSNVIAAPDVVYETVAG
ncbi:hypothetical protein [Actinoplanes rectilineatus]|uniref:hypothetical protein n=1 Tax=Actinoplanes rectilineatus TaxID=113571 RepID=UPI0005F27ED7|nr:hypothetical protein [Actinoplanes rectilineatus]